MPRSGRKRELPQFRRFATAPAEAQGTSTGDGKHRGRFYVLVLWLFCFTKYVYYILHARACQPFCRHRDCSSLTRAETTKSGDVRRVVGLCGLFREGVGKDSLANCGRHFSEVLGGVNICDAVIKEER